MYLERLPQARLESRTKAASDTTLSMISQHRNVVAVGVPPQFVKGASSTTTGTQPSGCRGVSIAPCCSVTAAFLFAEPRMLVVASRCACSSTSSMLTIANASELTALSTERTTYEQIILWMHCSLLRGGHLGLWCFLVV